MISPDLVRARRMGDRLLIIPLKENERTRAAELAQIFLKLAHDLVGHSREDWEENIHSLLFLSPKEKRIALALIKLIENLSVFDLSDTSISPEVLRQDLFLRATIHRRRQAVSGIFSREAILSEVSQAFGISQDQIEKQLYADLKSAQCLKSAPNYTVEQLMLLYEQSQAQAVLLRAVHVVVEVKCSSAKAYRVFFRKLKFLRLLALIRAIPTGGYRIEINGPFSLFEATTKYGLQLALLLPILTQCQQFQLKANIRWGKTRMPLHFQLEGGLSRQQSTAPSSESEEMVEELALFLPRFAALKTPWHVSSSSEILDLPGIGICIPDLQFIHKDTGETIYFELLGYWSREAVWRRVELVQKGLPYTILFAVSKRLRVSEQALDEKLPGMLYVFNESLNAKIISDRLIELSSRKKDDMFSLDFQGKLDMLSSNRKARGK